AALNLPAGQEAEDAVDAGEAQRLGDGFRRVGQEGALGGAALFQHRRQGHGVVTQRGDARRGVAEAVPVALAKGVPQR
ncbi:hypothetical protein DF186_24670, partial [Enterococcus hirae]